MFDSRKDRFLIQERNRYWNDSILFLPKAILGSVDIHFSHKYIAAMLRNDIKLSAVLS